MAPSRILFIAIAPKYTGEGDYRPLPGAERSIRRVRDALEQCGLATACAWFVCTEDTTVEAITTTVGHVADQLQENDIVVCYCCGHGYQYVDGTYLAASNGELLPTRALTAILAQRALDNMVFGVQLVLVIDTCRETPSPTSMTPPVSHAASGSTSGTCCRAVQVVGCRGVTLLVHWLPPLPQMYMPICV